ncbi:hypothetical protein FB451DRAFT_1291881 [Mycena latifolia]|nr:hypothetical protein FB451DRAFT_1291881 [Mycena latifolia]
METQPTFPLELEREIFEITALMHPSTIPLVLRVARRVLIWIEPLLYRVVHISALPPHPPMARAFLLATKTKPPTFFHAVRRMLLEDGVWDLEETRVILKLCTRIVDLAAMRETVDPTLLPILTKMPLRRLSVALYELFGGIGSIDFTHPMFTSITHLDAFDDPRHIYARIPSLPSLTHLSLDTRVSSDVLKTLLENCPRLEILIVAFGAVAHDDVLEYARTTPISDVRFVVGLWPDYDAPDGLPNFWALADDFVARKRRGEIDAGCYWLYT